MVGDITVQVAELDRDRYTRVAEVDFAGKKIRTPCFATHIQSPNEFNIFYELNERYLPTRLDAFVVKYFDAPNVLRKLHPQVKNDIYGRVREDKYTLFMKNHLLMVDPATECLYYDAKLGSFSLNYNTPKCILDYAAKLRKEKLSREPNFERRKERLHKQFWKDIVGDTSKKMAFVKSILDYQRVQCNVDVLLPPTPLISDDETLKMAIEINDTAKEIARINRKLCATYLNVKSTVLKDDDLMDKIKVAVYTNPSKSLTAFKFKNLDLSIPKADVQRENYRQLMLDLAYFNQDNKDRTCLVLENGCQCFVSPFAGFDFVSSSFTLFDNDVVSYSEHPPYGSYFDIFDKIHRKFDDVAVAYSVTKRLKCPCRSCQDVKVPDLKLLSPDEWFKIRRMHIPMYMDYWMQTIVRAVKERNTELARDNFSNSKVSNLKDLLP